VFDGVDEASQPVMKEARDRIETVRKADFTIKLEDGAGRPVAGEVRVKLRRHAFDFGANLGGELFRSAKLPKETRAEALTVCDELFSIVRTGEQWCHHQAERGGPHGWDIIEPEVEWARAHGKAMRFHCLFYDLPWFLPKWHASVASADDWWPLMEAHVAAVAERYGTLIQEYDVINEMESTALTEQLESRSPTTFPRLKSPDVGAQTFEMTRRYLPRATLVSLEDGWPGIVSSPELLEATRCYQEKLVSLSPDVDVVGTQCHFYAPDQTPFAQGHPRFGPKAFTMGFISEWLDRFGALGKPVHIPEFNPPSRRKEIDGPQPRLSDEEVAAWTVNFYTLVFSKPYVRQLTRWFLVDAVCGRGLDAGLVTQEGERKPAYHALKQLLKKEWITAASGRTDADGRFRFRGFLGTYDVTVNGQNTGCIDLRSDATSPMAVLFSR